MNSYDRVDRKLAEIIERLERIEERMASATLTLIPPRVMGDPPVMRPHPLPVIGAGIAGLVAAETFKGRKKVKT